MIGMKRQGTSLIGACSLLACAIGPAWAQQVTAPKPDHPRLSTGNNVAPSTYVHTFTYTCAEVTFTFRRRFDAVHRVTGVEQVVGDRIYPSPELETRLDELGNHRQAFFQAIDCRDDGDGMSLLVEAIQLATPTRPQSEVKRLAFVLHASGGITIEGEK